MTLTAKTVETPAFIVNAARAMDNIAAFQAHCDAAGLALRPHIKTHKTLHFAKAQLAAGAKGITCQKLGEAEVMAAGGCGDILITFNILGEAKLRRLRALAERAVIRVVADNPAVVAGLSRAFADAPGALRVSVECDTGAKRCGVQTPGAAVALARMIDESPGLCFDGLLTYPPAGGQESVLGFLSAAKAQLEAEGLPCPTISSGGSPDMWQAQSGGVITEYRIGTYIYNDRSLVERGTCGWEECAGHVLATVVSRPTETRAVIDAGSKALTSDLLGLEGHGHVLGQPEVRITGLSEEHGVLALPNGSPLAVGDRLRIVPNHVCVVANLFDSAWLETDTGTLEPLQTDARGLVT